MIGIDIIIEIEIIILIINHRTVFVFFSGILVSNLSIRLNVDLITITSSVNIMVAIILIKMQTTINSNNLIIISFLYYSYIFIRKYFLCFLFEIGINILVWYMFFSDI